MTMPRTPARFTKADAARAINAATESRRPAIVDFLPDGTIRVAVNVDMGEFRPAPPPKGLQEEAEPEL